jgi:hypothetical protein
MSTIIYIVIAVIAIVMFCVFVLPTLSTQEKKEKPTQPEHFDLLDENGNSIKEPKAKIVIEDGNSDAPIQELQYFCIKDKGYNVSVWPKDQGFRGIDYIEFRIAGITHYDDGSHIGEFIAMLRPEPDNPYDSNAIAIYATDGKKIGYVPKDMTDEVRHYTQLPSFCYCYIGSCQGTLFSDCYISDALKVSPN